MWDNLLKRLEGVRWEYDGFGRMTERHDSHRGTVQRFSYDDEHRISQVIIEGNAEFTRAAYRYDALGRRTEKQVWRRHTRSAERTQYAWSGLQMVGECSDSNPDAAVQYIYTENSYEPLARVDSRGEHAEVYWYHTELNGLPEKVTDSSGDVIWQGVSTTWGCSERENSNADWDVPQNLRFQGQYLDRETGLHYNTFRYYDPCGGRYTQMDPIGLLGGLNTYTYVVDPLGWVDPWGLMCVPAKPEKVVNALKNFAGKDFHIGSQTFKLDKSGMKHILERHHPEYWDGSSKAQQSFLSSKMSINDVTDAITAVMKQNREVLVNRGSQGMYQIQGIHDGVEYTLGLNKGRIGQFYPN